MKKLLLAILLCLMLTVLFALCAAADTAADITGECTLRFPGAAGHSSHMHDGDYGTYMEAPRKETHKLYITTGDTPAAGVYVEFGIRRLPFDVQVKREGKWETVASSSGLFAQEYVAFPPVTGEIRLNIGGTGRSRVIRVCELTVLGEGEIDTDKIHIWEPTAEKADLLLSATHADDELLWFGGMIPYYTIERNMNVLVSYLAISDSFRELELLNGLWHCGVRNYPEIAYLKDFSAFRKKDVYDKWGRHAASEYLTRLIRKYHPEVVVTHDYDGEYGHGQHLVCAEATEEAVSYAADSSKYKDSYKEYGAWDVKKFYVHLGDNPTVMDWDRPMAARYGKTSFEIASEAYQMHRSQLISGNTYVMAERGSEYDGYLFTLIHSTVGEDTMGGDLFENIPPETLTTH